MHKVKMLKTIKGYDDIGSGRQLREYEKGKTYPVTGAFLSDLIEDGAVEMVEEEKETKIKKEPETKPAAKKTSKKGKTE